MLPTEYNFTMDPQVYKQCLYFKIGENHTVHLKQNGTDLGECRIKRENRYCDSGYANYYCSNLEDDKEKCENYIKSPFRNLIFGAANIESVVIYALKLAHITTLTLNCGAWCGKYLSRKYGNNYGNHRQWRQCPK